jgi:hypothetical protein
MMPRQRMGQAETWQVQYAWLLTLLQSCAAADQSLGIAAGNVPVRICEVSPPDDVGGYPAIGIQFVSQSNQPDSQRIRIQDNTFDITVLVQGGFDPTAADIDRTTKIALENLLNDGQGHGLLPVLYSDITLGGTALYSINSFTGTDIGRSEDEGAGVSGRAFITFVATAEQQYQ